MSDRDDAIKRAWAITLCGASNMKLDVAENLVASVWPTIAAPTQGADARPVAIKRVRFPDLSEELYEHYVQMSAQTHAAEVKKYAKSVLATRDAAPSDAQDLMRALNAAAQIQAKHYGDGMRTHLALADWSIQFAEAIAASAPREET